MEKLTSMFHRVFRTRTIKIWRDITAHKLRALLVIVSIFSGVLGVVSLTTMGELISDQLEHDLRPSEMAMLRIFVDAPPGQPIDNDAVFSILRAQETVTRVEGQAVYPFEWRKPEADDFRSGILYAYSEPFNEIELEPVRLLHGRYPIDGHNELAIEQRMADRFGLGLGDALEVRTRDNGIQPFQIVGIVFQPYLYIGAGDGTTSAYATYHDAQQIVGFTGFSSFYARFTNFGEALQRSGRMRRTLEATTPYRVVVHIRTNPATNPFLVSIQQFTQVLAALAVVVLVVACLLVANIINVIVVQQRRQIGTIKALGATRWNILGIYLGLALAYGVVGTIPGVALGIPLGQWAARQIAPLANTILMDTPISWRSVGFGMGLGLLMPVAAALVPALNATRVSILEAMTDQGLETSYGRGLLPLLVRVARIPMLLEHVLNNIFRRKARLALTFLALTTAAGAFMGMVVVVDTLDGVVGYVEDHFGKTIESNLDTMDLANLRESLLLPERIMAIKQNTAVELTLPHATESTADDAATSGDDSPDTVDQDGHLYVVGLDTVNDIDKISLIEGTAWQNNPDRRGVVLTKEAANTYDKTLGDTIFLQSPSTEAVFEIIGIADLPLEIGFMEWHQLRDFVGEIRSAPTPNAYWEQLHIYPETAPSPFEEEGGIWAVGISEPVGKFLTPDYDPEQSGVIISRAVAKAGGWQTGDEIRLSPIENEDVLDLLFSPPEKIYPILAVVDITPAQIAMISGKLPPELRTIVEQESADQLAVIAMDWQALAELVELDYNRLTPDMFQFDLTNSTLNGTQTIPRPVFYNQDSFGKRVAQIMVGVSGVMSFAALLMAIVGGIGLLTIMSVNVLERQREIGVLRSVGATSTAILTQYLLEGVLIGIGAWIAGLPLSYLISRALISLTPYHDVIVFHFGPIAPVLGFMGMLIVTFLATLYPAITATRKTVSEILRYK